ncbi:MAG: glycosyltransferase family 4 protein [Oscillospiraceae bacterium]|nr:glycosyltransferase family 4 protein [Oscillospiraceae bacterium]
MNCCLIVNKSESVLNFRLGLIRKLQENGHRVSVIASDDERKSDIAKLNISFYCVTHDNRGLNPFSIARYLKKIYQIVKKEAPDLVFTFQLKPNTFGVFGAKAAGVDRIYSMVEGAGDVFIKQTLPWKLIRTIACVLYRYAFRNSGKVFFLNQEDKTEFVSRRLVAEEKAMVIPGIGVDLERFAYKPVRNLRSFLMIARLHREKGVFEYCECARIVRKKYPDARFNFLGPEREIKIADIQEYIDDGSIDYLGTVHDVRPYLEECTCMVLPSYREGMPMSIMEAEAVGRGIITCDNVGCRDTVLEGYNGFLVPHRDVDALAEKCIYIIEHPEEVIRLGENSRRFAQEHFDQNMINQILMNELSR